MLAVTFVSASVINMLVDLPQEILDSIARHLDLPSARALALTSHTTRKAAETVI